MSKLKYYLNPALLLQNYYDLFHFDCTNVTKVSFFSQKKVDKHAKLVYNLFVTIQ